MRSHSPSFRSMGFPEAMESRKSSAPPTSGSGGGGETAVPIRVLHEKANNNNKHKYAPHSSQTTDLPSRPSAEAAAPHGEAGAGSPRVTRAYSEPPKTFNQRLLNSKIGVPETVGEEKQNLSTSASESHVPNRNIHDQEAPKVPPRRPSPKSKQQQQQHQHHQEPSVRHIPIFVEGRDKPVVNTPPSSSCAQEPTSPFTRPSEFYPPTAEVVRNQKKQPGDPSSRRPTTAPPTHLNVSKKSTEGGKVAEPTSPLSPIPSDQPIPMGYSEPAKEDAPGVNGEPTSPLAMPAGPTPLPCSSTLMSQDVTDSGNSSQSESVSSADQTGKPEQQQPQKASEAKKDPRLDKLAEVEAAVADLVKKTEAFKGSKKDKEYLFLDEMLTRNLLILDGIETEGRDDVRQKRRESIKSINRCLSVLESKATSQSSAQAEKNNEILSELAQASSSATK